MRAGFTNLTFTNLPTVVRIIVDGYAKFFYKSERNQPSLYIPLLMIIFWTTYVKTEVKRLENDPGVSLQPLSTLSASSLQLLHERTMINTDLDLDSLDESASSNPFHLESASVTSSQTGLLHPLVPRYNGV